jgi:hypothetical protein
MHYFVFSTCFEKKRELYNEKNRVIGTVNSAYSDIVVWK